MGNGLPASDAVLAQGPDGQWQMDWNTSFLTNGTYQIQLDCPVAPASSPDSITDVMGAPVTVQVDNPISMDKLTSQFTSYLYIYGTLADTNDTFDVYLYDDYGNPLVYATGLSATNGQIAIGWDLTDGNGNQISFGNIEAVFVLHSGTGSGAIQPADASDPTTVHHWFIKDVAGSIDNNVFSVAWGYDGLFSYLPQFVGYRTECMQDGVIDILGDPSVASYNLVPVENIPFGDSAFRYDTDSDKSILMHALNVSRNFYWFGHGSSGVIMGNESRSTLQSSDVENLLGNHAWHKSQKHPLNNAHPYFLTILNGCETYSPIWAGAFGVEFSENGTSDSVYDYQAVGLAPRAFVGWTKTIGVPGQNDLFWEGILDADYGDALSYMFNAWMLGYPLSYCVDSFSSQILYLQPTPGLFQNQDSWEISGCYDLERGD